MSDTTHPAGAGGQGGHEGEGATRRDFLYLATGAVAAVGVASAAWPFIDSMNPAADTLRSRRSMSTCRRSRSVSRSP
jgi:ubiquinol-cytochrome c reductase iron-sulfur subunit